MSIARTRVSLYPCPTSMSTKLQEAQLFPDSNSVLVVLTSGTHGREICEIPEGPECGNQGRCCWHCPRLRLVQSPWVLPKGLWNVSGASGFLHGRLSLRAWESWEVLKVIPALSSHFRTRGYFGMGVASGGASSSRSAGQSQKASPPDNMTIMTSVVQG